MLRKLSVCGLLAIALTSPMAHANARRWIADAVEPGGNYAIRKMRGIDLETGEEALVPSIRVRLVSNVDFEFDLLAIASYGGPKDVAPWLEHRESFWAGHGPTYHFSTFHYEFDNRSATLTVLRQTPVSNGVCLTDVYLLKYGHKTTVLVSSQMERSTEEQILSALKDALAIKPKTEFRYSEAHIKSYGLKGPFEKFAETLGIEIPTL